MPTVVEPWVPEHVAPSARNTTLLTGPVSATAIGTSTPNVLLSGIATTPPVYANRVEVVLGRPVDTARSSTVGCVPTPLKLTDSWNGSFSPHTALDDTVNANGVVFVVVPPDSTLGNVELADVIVTHGDGDDSVADTTVAPAPPAFRSWIDSWP